MGLPGTYDIDIYQGDRYELFLRIREATIDSDGEIIPGDYVDLTSKTVTAEIRATIGAVTVEETFTCTLSDQNTTPGGVTLVLTPAQTKPLTGSYVWDVQVKTDAENITTYLAGAITVTGEVTDDV